MNSGATPYGLEAMIKEGGFVTIAILAVLVIMSLGSWYIMFDKYFQQRKILREADTLNSRFWMANSLKDGSTKLDKQSAFRQLVDDGLKAADHHEGRLTDKIDRNEWISATLNRSSSAINSRLSAGLAFLATVGSTAPFVGLLGTVLGIYNALVGIGVAGQASIDKVAGPVGEALIMTAIGLFVAVPAVLGYNLLIRRNKNIQEKLFNFASDVQGFLMGGSRMTMSTNSTGLPDPKAQTVPGATTARA